MANLIAAAFPTNPIIAAATLQELCRSNRLYASFITPRSGSTWLTEMASAGGQLGTPQEWFNETFLQTNLEFLGCRPPRLVGTSDINEYISISIASHRSPANIMGLQLSFYQAQSLFKLVEAPEPAKAAMTFFYLRRRNLVAQAVSLYRSVVSGRFHSYETDREAVARFGAVVFDAEKVAYWVEHLLASEIGFEAMFRSCGLEVHRFFYEDLVAHPGQTLNWLHVIAAGENGPRPRPAPPPGPGQVLPLGDEKNREWETRFRDEQRALLDSARSSCPGAAGLTFPRIKRVVSQISHCEKRNDEATPLSERTGRGLPCMVTARGPLDRCRTPRMNR